MKIFKEVSLGFLTAIASSLVILGAMIVSITEGTSMLKPTLEPLPTFPAVVESLVAGGPTSTLLPPSPTARQVMVTNTPPNTPCPPPAGWVSIYLSQGDDVKAIAAERGVNIEDLKRFNCTNGFAAGSNVFVPPLPTPTLTPSLTLTFTLTMSLTPSSTVCPGPPANWVRYIVKPGDYLSILAAATGTTVQDIQNKNCLTTTLINSGSVLYLPRYPGGTATATLRPTLTRTSVPTRPRTPIPTSLPTITPTGTNIATLTSTLTSTETLTPAPTSTSTSTTFTIVTATPKPSPTPTDTPIPPTP
jgi:LysM repeat protein